MFVEAVTAEIMALADSFQGHIDRYDELISESKSPEEQTHDELLNEGFESGAHLHEAMLLFCRMRKTVC